MTAHLENGYSNITFCIHMLVRSCNTGTAHVIHKYEYVGYNRLYFQERVDINCRDSIWFLGSHVLKDRFTEAIAGCPGVIEKTLRSSSSLQETPTRIRSLDIVVARNCAGGPAVVPWALGLLPDTQNCGCACAGNAMNVFPAPRVSDTDMHHGTCVTHVPWCMPGSLISGFLWSRWRGETFPAFPAHGQPAILRIW